MISCRDVFFIKELGEKFGKNLYCGQWSLSLLSLFQIELFNKKRFFSENSSEVCRFFRLSFNLKLQVQIGNFSRFSSLLEVTKRNLESNRWSFEEYPRPSEEYRTFSKGIQEHPRISKNIQEHPRPSLTQRVPMSNLKAACNIEYWTWTRFQLKTSLRKLPHLNLKVSLGNHRESQSLKTREVFQSF